MARLRMMKVNKLLVTMAMTLLMTKVKGLCH